MNNNDYWKQRFAESQNTLSNKNIKQIEKQLRIYYGTAARQIIADFEAVYNKLLTQKAEGKEITPADLYKLDKYWQMQGALRQRLQKLNERQVSALTKIFEINFFDVYYSINIEGLQAFNTIDSAGAQALINAIWVADGKSWSERIWQSTEKLGEMLNEQLLNTVITGKKTTQLKQMLQERFDVSYSRADALVRTELAHIQSTAAQQRYKDYGIREVEVWADKDERRCEECAKLHKTRYPVGTAAIVPIHVNCRCCLVPVID